MMVKENYMELLGKYKNGNYYVVIFDNGTKIRKTNSNKFIADFPECLDIKITNKCDMNCAFCHENSSKEGKHGDILNVEFIDTLMPYTELAIGGGNPLTHPDLLEFLSKLKHKKIIANITINQIHFEQNLNYIKNLVDNKLIKGLGISLTNPTEDFLNKVSEFPNTVIHLINGVTDMNSLRKLYNKNLKILILGYKKIRRGKDFFSSDVLLRASELYENLEEIIRNFDTVSFDNLAIKQLKVKRLMSKEEWDRFYMGDDGEFTMYVDMVNEKFAKSSVSKRRYDLMNNIGDMFKIIKMNDK